TRRQLTNGGPATTPIQGPMNSFTNIGEYPTADLKVVVRPNFDTLYSSAWLDLTKEPMVVSAPDTHGRYYLLPMLDMWTDVFASPGWRTTGTEAASFLIAPAGWHGTVPAGVTRITAPTPHVWIIGRIKTDGPADYTRTGAAIQLPCRLRTAERVTFDHGSRPQEVHVPANGRSPNCAPRRRG